MLEQIKLIVLASLILVVRNELSCTVRTSPTAKYATASVATPPPPSIKLHHPRSLPGCALGYGFRVSARVPARVPAKVTAPSVQKLSKVTSVTSRLEKS